jgi:hypothetical protein
MAISTMRKYVGPVLFTPEGFFGEEVTTFLVLKDLGVLGRPTSPNFLKSVFSFFLNTLEEGRLLRGMITKSGFCQFVGLL